MTAPPTPRVGFRQLCLRLRSAIKSLPKDQQGALGSSLASHIVEGRSYSYRINPSSFLSLCARLGINPVTGETVTPQADLGTLCTASIGCGCIMQRQLRNLSMRAAAAEIGISASTITRLEQNLPVSIESILSICEFIGVHPFSYMQSQRRAA